MFAIGKQLLLLHYSRGDIDRIFHLYGAYLPIYLEEHVAAFEGRSTCIDPRVDYTPIGHKIMLVSIFGFIGDPDCIRTGVTMGFQRFTKCLTEMKTRIKE